MNALNAKEQRVSEPFPNIDPRVKAVGVSKLRDMNASTLNELGDSVYLIQSNDVPIAVLISYKMALEIRAALSKGADREQ